MDGQPPLFQLQAAVHRNGECPFGDFIESEQDRKVRAQILTKIAYLSRIEPPDYGRPLIDTLEGPIKELRFGPRNSLRLLFSTEQEAGTIVLYGGERKREGPVSAALVAEALQLHKEWTPNGGGVEVDIDHLRDLIAAKRLEWPNE